MGRKEWLVPQVDKKVDKEVDKKVDKKVDEELDAGVRQDFGWVVKGS